MKEMLQSFLQIVESKPSYTDSIRAHENWQESYSIQRSRMANLFDSLLDVGELECIRDTLHLAIEAGTAQIEQINKAMNLQFAIERIYGKDAGIVGQIGEQMFESVSPEKATKIIKEMGERLSLLKSIENKVIAMLGIIEAQSLTGSI